MDPVADEDLLTIAEVKAWLRTSEGALAQMRFTGRGPAFIKLGGRSVRYRRADVRTWLDSRVRTRTDERTAPKAG